MPRSEAIIDSGRDTSSIRPVSPSLTSCSRRSVRSSSDCLPFWQTISSAVFLLCFWFSCTLLIDAPSVFRSGHHSPPWVVPAHLPELIGRVLRRFADARLRHGVYVSHDLAKVRLLLENESDTMTDSRSI